MTGDGVRLHFKDCHASAVAMSPASNEPAPPNRWAAFTDDELAAMSDSIDYADNAPYSEQATRIWSEIYDEQQRRKVPQ